MHRQNRTVLVVGMGTSPAVLTEKWATVAAQPQMSPQTDNGVQNVGLDVGLERTVIDEIRARPKIRMSEIALKFQVTKRTVERVFSKLTQQGRIARVGGKRFGHWEVVG